MLAHVYQTLEQRVGIRLASQMTEAQLDEFDRFIEGNDEEGALQWLGTNIPNYREVVRDELDLLRAELRQIAPAILALSGVSA